jgi:hypothetical protein
MESTHINIKSFVDVSQGTPQHDIFKVLRVSDDLGHKPTSNANELWRPPFGSLSQCNGPPATLRLIRLSSAT